MRAGQSITFRRPGMGWVVLGLMLKQGAGKLLEDPICQAEAFEDGVACHADNARVVRSPRAEQALPQISDQCAFCQMPMQDISATAEGFCDKGERRGGGGGGGGGGRVSGRPC